MDLNKAMIIGRLTSNPEARNTQNGASISSFSLATNRQWINQNGEIQKEVEYHNITAWSKLAEICNQYLLKGALVYIEGHLKTNCYEKDGQKHYNTNIITENIIMLGSKNEPQQPPHQDTSKEFTPPPVRPAIKNQEEEIKIEDIPF